jgi:riboflavin kinase/FMN adenylyltransferase
MQHFSSLDDIHLKKAYVSVGSYDGVHLGHREIISRLTRTAHQVAVPAVVVTFYPHPTEILGRPKGPIYLSLPDERADLLGQAGVDIVVTVNFTRSVRELSAWKFVSWLKTNLGMEKLYVGFNFKMGYKGDGDLAALSRIGNELGYSVEIIPPFLIEDRPVSSTQIRTLLLAGDVGKAACLLGRRYSITESVQTVSLSSARSDIVWTALSFPQERIVPGEGVYAVWAWVNDRKYAAACYTGFYAASFPDGVESQKEHGQSSFLALMNCDGNLAGQKIRIEFVDRIRGGQDGLIDTEDPFLVEQDVQSLREKLADGN